MKKAYMHRSTLACAIFLSLAACGGGNDGKTPAVINPVTPNNTNNAAPPARTNSNSGTNNTGSTEGRVLITSRNGATRPVENIIRGNNGFRALQVDGKIIQLEYPNLPSSGNFYEVNTSGVHSIISGKWLSYSRFGVHSDLNTGMDYTFYVGNPTPVSSIPASGSATYQGLAVMSVDQGEYETGDASFRADFNDRTLEGSVKVSGPDVILRGQIKANYFEGTHDGIAMEGRFFGPQASELGGMFAGERERLYGLSSDYVQGSFGATTNY